MFKFNTHVPLEQNVQSYLTEVRPSPFTFQVSMFDLYTELNKALAALPATAIDNSRYYKNYSLLAATFNKTIGDLKKVGIVSQTRDGHLYLSDAAWMLHKDKEEQRKKTQEYWAQQTKDGQLQGGLK